MPSPDVDLIGDIAQFLTSLRTACGWGKGNIKTKIDEAEKEIKNNPKLPNLMVIVSAFTEATHGSSNELISIALDCFTEIFTEATPKFFPSYEITDTIISSVFQIERTASDDVKMKCCRVISACISSPSGKYFIHAGAVFHITRFLLTITNITQAANVQEVASVTIKQVVTFLINQYNQEQEWPEFDKVEDLIKFCTDTVTRNAPNIREYAPNSHKATIKDVDLVVLCRTLTMCIQLKKFSPNTMKLICECILTILKSRSKFLKTSDFVVVLRTDVHVALLAITLDIQPMLIELAAEIILTIWKMFSYQYLEGLNEVLDKGVLTALSSPYPNITMNAFNLLSLLMKKPQFFIDIFVNYDCDKSGCFKNIFDSIVKCIIKASYPNPAAPKLQISALNTLTNLLRCLWTYFIKFNDKEVEPEEALTLLDSKREKDELDVAFQLFKRSPSKGIKFFIERGLVEDTPDAIAKYLFETPNLDPTGIGEIIGTGKNTEILHKFVSFFNFEGLSFEQAFRAFLSKFQIPGEAQMIDRVMEQFGVKFYNDNPNLFSCADTVYVLAFSTLMLHTDAHHPNVKSRMTLNEFVANNRGIDAGKDLPESFLENLYNGIKKEKIFVAKSATPSSSLLTRQQQKELYQEECMRTLTSARNRTTTELHQKTFHRAISPHLIGPIFHSIWGGILGAMSLSFEETEDEKIVATCIKGFELLMHLASHCYVEDALDTLVDSFAKNTRLQVQKSNFKPKNYQCLSALVGCALEDRAYLKGTWSIILKEISALDAIRGDPNVAGDIRVAETLFAETGTLDRESIIDFVKAMRDVSQAEIQEPSSRAFTLLKFLDVAYYNMDRPMLFWKDIWTEIGSYLAQVCQTSNAEVASASVDIIRQLSNKFIQKQEIKEFHFQQHFLQPFIDILDSQPSPVIKDLVLYCTNQIINDLSKDLHSGWDSIFQILTMTSLDPETNIIMEGFEILGKVVTDFLDCVHLYIVHLMSVIFAFVVNSRDIGLSVQAVTHYSLLSDVIQQDEEDNWKYLIQTIIKCSQQSALQVQTISQEILLSILTGHGAMKHQFTPGVWNYVFSTAIPKLFCPKKNNYEAKKIQIKKLCTHLIFKFYDQFIEYADFILRDFLLLMQNNNADFASFAGKLLVEFMPMNKSFNTDHQVIIEQLELAIPSITETEVFFEILNKFIEFYSNDEEMVDKLLVVFRKYANQHESIEAKTYVLNLLTKLNKTDEVTSFCCDIFQKYIETEDQKLDKLVVNCLEEIIKLDDEKLDECLKKSSEYICRIIETGSKVVRQKLVPIVQKKIST